jgi:DNA-binding NarL/FixJ family response regulator
MNAQKRKIILVEDSDLYRSTLKNLIENADKMYRVVAEARSGEKAIETIRDVPADLIMLDLYLPGLSGLSVIRESKKLNPAKILILSIHSAREIIQRAFEYGADGYCPKEADRSLILSAIKETLKGMRPCYTEEFQRGNPYY